MATQVKYEEVNITAGDFITEALAHKNPDEMFYIPSYETTSNKDLTTSYCNFYFNRGPAPDGTNQYINLTIQSADEEQGFDIPATARSMDEYRKDRADYLKKFNITKITTRDDKTAPHLSFYPKKFDGSESLLFKAAEIICTWHQNHTAERIRAGKRLLRCAEDNPTLTIEQVYNKYLETATNKLNRYPLFGESNYRDLIVRPVDAGKPTEFNIAKMVTVNKTDVATSHVQRDYKDSTGNKKALEKPICRLKLKFQPMKEGPNQEKIYKVGTLVYNADKTYMSGDNAVFVDYKHPKTGAELDTHNVFNAFDGHFVKFCTIKCGQIIYSNLAVSVQADIVMLMMKKKTEKKAAGLAPTPAMIEYLRSQSGLATQPTVPTVQPTPVQTQDLDQDGNPIVAVVETPVVAVDDSNLT